MSPTLIISVILIYFTALFLVSWFTGKDSSNAAFFVGNKQSPWYLVAFGMIGASLSGVTFVSIPGAVGNFKDTNGYFSYMQLAAGYLMGYAVIALVLMPLYYRLNLTSIYSYLEQRFGFWSYKTGAFFFILSRTIGASFRLFLAISVLQIFVFDALHIHFVVNALLTVFLIWAYTTRGGVRTLIYTDTFQTTFLVAALVLIIYSIAQELHLSASGVISTISESPYCKFIFTDPLEARFFPKQFFGGMFVAIAMTGLDQDLMQKNISCKNIGEAQKNMFTFSAIVFVVNLLFVGLGALLYIYANAKGIAIPERSDHLFPTLALHYFPLVASVMFLLGILSATHASADAALTSLTTSFCVDFLGFQQQSNTQTEQQLRKTRHWVHLGFSVLLFVIILLFYYVLDKSVVTTLFKVANFTYGPLLGLYAFGLFIPNRQVRDNLVPMVCVVAPIICYILNANSTIWLGGYQFGNEMLIINGALTFVGLWAISHRVK
jgi:Na+/proline symporter